MGDEAGAPNGAPAFFVAEPGARERCVMIAGVNASTDRLPALAVVGHTNVGKTSLMRTLMRDARFGQVAPTAATTRRVERARLLADGRPVLELFDTPGLEDAGGLIELLERTARARHAGPERIRAFLASSHAEGRFEQEARVLRQVLDSDAILYVVDVREPVLGKYQDELAAIALGARPVLPVLNFTADARSRTDAWRDALARVGLHAVAEFDTVVFSLAAEATLWRRLATLSEAQAPALERLIADREAQAAWQAASARRLIAELLVEVAAARRLAPRDDAAAIDQARADLEHTVAEREHAFVEQLLALFRFAEDDYRDVPLPIGREGWATDPFDPRTLALVGPRAGGGAAAGAAAGAAVDLAAGGLSLGAGTVIGALTGGGAGAAWLYRRRLGDRLRGRTSIVADDAALTVIAARAFALLDALRQRGHAATAPVRVTEALPDPWPQRGLPAALVRARMQPECSALNQQRPHAEKRRALVDRLVDALVAGGPAGRS
jgi:hypothetical protein